MDITNPVASPSRKSGGRSPLSNRANIIPIDNTTTAGGSSTTNWDRRDSSEGRPSTHDSICDAAWVSTSDLAKSPYQTPGRPVTPTPRFIDIDLDIDHDLAIDLDSDSPLSRLEETPFLYGYGTELAPILEQRSVATLRTKRSQSTSDLSSLLHDAPKAGAGEGRGSVTAKSHSKSDITAKDSPHHHLLSRRRRSSSLDDAVVESIPRLKRLTYSRPRVHIVDVHAYPRKPVYPPPQRAATPPNIRRVTRPWSEGDAYVASSSHNNDNNNNGSFRRGVITAYEAPGFRPLRSGHGNLSSHPFVISANTVMPTIMTTTSIPASVGLSSARPRQPRRGGVRRASTRAAAPAASGISTVGREGACKKCRHPRDEWWSLGATLVGHGPGMRRGSDWCGRCACRKVIRGWCCGELGQEE